MHAICKFIADNDQALPCRPLGPNKLAQLAKQARGRLAPSTRKDYDEIINVFGVSTCGSLGREGVTASGPMHGSLVGMHIYSKVSWRYKQMQIDHHS